MRRIFQGKVPVLLFSAFALFALILLAGELKSATFKPAQPLGRAGAKPLQSPLKAIIEQIAEIPVWKQVAFWLAAFAIVLLISSLLSPELRKWLIKAFLRLAAFMILVMYIVRNNPTLIQDLLEPPQTGMTGEIVNSAPIPPPPVFQPPQFSALYSFLVAFGITLVVIVALWMVYRAWARGRSLRSNKRALKEIAAAARASLNDLSAGQDSGDAIIRCYARMTRAVSEKRGIQRADAMTPAEFALRLEEAGLPRNSVQRLTALFEVARYGSRQSEQNDINEATNCLQFVLQYCGETL